MIVWCFLQFFFSPTIHIQPLGRVPTEHIKIVEQAVKSLYGIACTIQPAKPHDRTLYAASGYRYDAEKILTRFKSHQFVLVITEKTSHTIRVHSIPNGESLVLPGFQAKLV
jgi:hypothetical protein